MNDGELATDLHFTLSYVSFSAMIVLIIIIVMLIILLHQYFTSDINRMQSCYAQ